MNSLPRKNYALNRVSHLTKSSHAIAIQAITANLSRIRHSYSTVSSIDLQSLNLSQIFTTYLNLMACAPMRSNLLAHGTSCISPGGSSSASSYFTKPINFIAAAGYEPSHSPALSNADISAIKILVVAFNDFSNRAYSSQESHFSLLNLIFINHKKFKQRELINNKLLINHKHSGNNNLKSVGWNLCK